MEFQAREHALFIQSQLAFYGGFLDTITAEIPRFGMSEVKV